MGSLTLHVTDRAVADEIVALDPDSVREIHSRSFDGVEPVITLVALLSPLLLREIFRLVRTCIESRQHVRVFYQGVEIQGVSEESLLEILEQVKSAAPSARDDAAG